jgi:hypothetical protein
MKIFEIEKGTTFHIDCEKDTILRSVPVQLSEDIKVSSETVLFTNCACGNCSRPIAVVSVSHHTQMIFDRDDLIQVPH